MQQGKENHVCKLKSLYELMQFSRVWYQKIDTFLVQNEFAQSIAHHSLYLMQECNDVMMVIIYVDDLIILARLL